jgi:hypothetical protein
MAQSVAHTASRPRTITLYSPFPYLGSAPRSFFDFQMQEIADRSQHWDLSYGTLYAGDDHDWFKVSTLPGDRTALKDLGELTWDDQFDIPEVQPFPELKPGEQRIIAVNMSGKAGEDGLPGGARIRSFHDKAPAEVTDVIYSGPSPVTGGMPGSVQFHSAWPAPEAPPVIRRPKPKPSPRYIDPVYVKAVVGHMYVIHVVSPGADFYALYRVESLSSGDNCTISWKLIPTPQDGNSQ